MPAPAAAPGSGTNAPPDLTAAANPAQPALRPDDEKVPEHVLMEDISRAIQRQRRLEACRTACQLGSAILGAVARELGDDEWPFQNAGYLTPEGCSRAARAIRKRIGELGFCGFPMMTISRDELQVFRELGGGWLDIDKELQ
ncbi:MAG: hypothetical protein ACYDH9_26615 [Limisphaerales bacterium]